MNPPLSYISPKAAVKPSPIAGRGLFALEPIRQGEIVCIPGEKNRHIMSGIA
jgi:SET domain-containing protein